MSSMKVKRLETERDRLSDLPDHLLCHILSFLPITDVVRTSSLSTGWKNLYTLVPTLILEEDNLPRRGFMNIVDRVLFARKGIDVGKFVLTCRKVVDPSGAINPSRFKAWVQYALWHNVKELDLRFWRPLITVPVGLFTCKTLVSLKLTMNKNGRSEFKIPSIVSLPSLKILHLQSIVFSDNYSVERLFSSCSALEELLLHHCFYKNITRFNISNPALKRLTINHYGDYLYGYEILINAPNLVYLKFDHFRAKNYLLIDLHSLVEAHIDDFGYPSGRADLIRGLRHVQSLCLAGRYSGALKPGLGPIPTLESMINLKIGKFYDEGWERLLNFAPCLETLVFEELPYYEKNIFNPPKKVPPCLISRMKAIKFLLFRGKKFEMQVVEYFLKHGRVLENLIIHLETTEDLLVVITEKLLKFPRVSEKCQVIIG